MNAIRRHLWAATVIVMLLTLALAQSAAAHAGHAHADEGMDVSTVLSIAGVVLALGIAWRMTSRLSRAEIPGDEENTTID